MSEINRVVNDIKRKIIASADETAIAAAEALYFLAEKCEAENRENFMKVFVKTCNMFSNARKTSASLQNCVRYIFLRANRAYEEGLDLKDLRDTIKKASKSFVKKIREAKERIGEIGAERILDGDVILTHGFSTTVQSIIRCAIESGKNIEVYVTEARPMFEGRIMAKLLASLGIKTTLIVDGAARVFMNDINKVLVGAEAIAVNGAVVNKIGTSTIAVLAYEARTRLLFAAGTYKLCPETLIGGLIEIEEGSSTQVLDSEALEGVEIRNPLYDITPPDYIDAIITERGVIPPQGAYFLLRDIAREDYGWDI